MPFVSKTKLLTHFASKQDCGILECDLKTRFAHKVTKWEYIDTIAESFYYVNYGSSIIASKVRQIISVMKAESLVFPEK